MPVRAASPSVSENGVDIAAGLLYHGSGKAEESAEEDGQLSTRDQRLKHLDHGSLLPEASEDSGSDDGDFIADSLAAAQRKASSIKTGSVRKGGGFHAMGLNPSLLKAIARKGFSIPTPIQRKTVPLILDGRDVVGMARTGSGKTAAFVLPMIEKLKTHSARMGARALVLSPSRELALQTLKVAKEMARGTDLKCALLVGGDSLEEQFGVVSANPDIVIATPGRFLHLKVEMGLDLSSLTYVVFDEADRLFEMGFATQLTEILHALPPSRQTLLFSATLPKSLVEFARAGLQEPELVRLDAESKISPDLQSAFFTLKGAEKEGALLQVLGDVIKMPTGETEAAKAAKEMSKVAGKKRKRQGELPTQKVEPSQQSTIVFTATKHHVEYLAHFLKGSGYAVSYVYGSLDQTARKMQVQDFRSGITNILVVTDVAARGIDIPILANVINYDFPAQPKIFVHRVGRTARAGQQGWSYSLVRPSDTPYLLDLQLFLGKRLFDGKRGASGPSYVDDVVVGAFPRDRLESNCEWASKLQEEDSDLLALRSVAARAEKLYLRTRNSASVESARRAKTVADSEFWSKTHPLLRDEKNDEEKELVDMLARVSSFRPSETVFEIGRRGRFDEAAEVIKKRRAAVESQRKRKANGERQRTVGDEEQGPETNGDLEDTTHQDNEGDPFEVEMESASDADLEVTFSTNGKPNGSKKARSDFKSSEFFMSYTPSNSNAIEDRGYGVHSGSATSNYTGGNFVSAAQSATMDLVADEGQNGSAIGAPSRLRWDKRSKKYISSDNANSKTTGEKRGVIRSESGGKIAASFRSGRFDAWKRKNRIADRHPTTADAPAQQDGGKMYRHKSTKQAHAPDKYRDDYHKKRKKMLAAGETQDANGDGPVTKSLDAVRKERVTKERRKARNGPGKKKGLRKRRA